MKKYNLSNIMKRAWALVKELKITISCGLKKAWEEAKNIMKIKVGTDKSANEFIVKHLEEKNPPKAEEVKAFDHKYNDGTAEIEVPQLEGVSDKQIAYAESIRRGILQRCAEGVFNRSRRLNAAQLDEVFAQANVSTLSEFVKFAVESNCSELLSMKTAKDVIESRLGGKKS